MPSWDRDVIAGVRGEGEGGEEEKRSSLRSGEGDPRYDSDEALGIVEFHGREFLTATVSRGHGVLSDARVTTLLGELSELRLFHSRRRKLLSVPTRAENRESS